MSFLLIQEERETWRSEMPAQSNRRWIFIFSLAVAPCILFLLIHFLAPGASADVIPPSMANAAIRYVDTGGDDSGNDCLDSSSPCATIQQAIDLAVAGDEVRVAAGTYDQVQVKSNAQGVTFTQIAYIDKGLVLQGGFTTSNWNSADPQNNVTILDPQGHGRGVTILDTYSDPVTVDGFTITNGDYTGLGNPPDQNNLSCNRAGEDCAGAIFGRGSTLNFKNLLLTNNIGSRVGGDGGAIYLISAREVTIENTQVISNSSLGAGGMFVLWQNYPFTIKDSLFQENTARFGGGLVMNDFRTQVTIERTDFISNVATQYEAGGAYIRPAAQNGDLTMDRVRLIGNQAAGNGDALWLNSTTSSTDVDLRLTNLILAHNANPPGTTAAADDAAIYASTRFKTVNLSLAHVTAADNPLTNFLYVLADNDAGEQTLVQITNTLVSDVDYAFAGETIDNGSVTLTDTNSLLFDIGIASYHDLGGSVTFSGSSTVTDDPLLDGAYHLTAGSGAIDTGVSSGISHDIDGQYRPQSAAPDIGADEFYQEVAPSNVSISGPGIVVAQSPAEFVAEVSPLATTLPITYVWQATGHETITQTAGLSDTVSFTWSSLGNKVVQVSASNAYGTVNDSFNLEVIGEPLLAIRKQGPAEAVVGSTITYTLTISNEGVTGATGLVITDTVPAPVTSVTPLDGGTMPDSNTVQWTASSLAAGAKMIVRFQVTADQTLVNEAYAVSADGGYSASGSEVVTTVFGTPDLAISKDGPASAGSGEPIQYELTVTNNGAIASHDLVISDTLPAGATYLSGGTLVGDVVRFQVPVVGANGGVAKLFFSVTASQSIVNQDYEVVDGDGFSAQGGEAIHTVVGSGPRYVAPGGNDTLNACTESASPCATIQHAIDVANAGEEVRVAAGTYDQVQIKSNAQGVTFTQIAYIDKGLVLQGGFTTGDWNSADPQNNVTTLDPQGHGRGVTILDTYNNPVTIDGFTITNGDYTGLGNPPDQSNLSCNRAGEDCAGAIFGRGSAMNFKNLLLTNNIGSRVGGDGGAIYLISAREVTVENTRVISNTSISAGGMFVLWQNYPFTIKECLFQENTAGFGGGLVLNDFRTQVTIERTEFISNVATMSEAGGAYIRPASNNGHLTMDRVRFIGNQAVGYGKALWLNSTTSGTDVEMRLTNLILAHNANPVGTAAAEDDAAIYVSTRFKTVDLSLAHVTAADNPLTNFLYVQAENNAGEQTRVQIANTLVTGVDYAFAGETVEDGTLALTDTNSLLFDIGTAPYHDLGDSVTFSGSGTVTGDPLLTGSYHLAFGSAAIDAGINAGVLYDIDGEARPYGDLPDIGADELTIRFVYLPVIITP
jgi:uncharacterized repeat protein (TIGR01451 family)